ncbi:MAG: N-formylglutamate amidohydrolase [Coriobacteriia bacterium]
MSAGREPAFRITSGHGAVIAVALHAGHAIRPGLCDYIVLSEDDRSREEDTYTALMAPDGMPLIEVVRSRFEVDLNRPRERAVYMGPDDAWGMDLYRRPLSSEVRAVSLAMYDEFYETAYTVLSEMERTQGRFVVLDLHSYNHRREGMSAAPAPDELNPEVNLGTGRIHRDRWLPVIEGFMSSMARHGFDCRENVKFRGGHLSQWVNDTFPESGLTLAIEFKKSYMDEWTGRPDPAAIARIRRGLAGATATIERILPETA